MNVQQSCCQRSHLRERLGEKNGTSGRLNNPILDGRNAQRSLPAIGFGDVYPLDVLRLVASAAQFLFESAAMGVVGGVIGASLGVLIVIGVSAYQVWSPVLDPAAPLLAPLGGGVIGVVSGLCPVSRAARLEPVEAFRN